jgi:hypothetical protein
LKQVFHAIDFQIINFTRPEGGDNTSSISPTDNAVKLFMWKSYYHEIMKTDPTIDRIRKIRHEISEEFDHDPKKLIEYYVKHQQKYKKLIKAPMSVSVIPPSEMAMEIMT